MSRTPRFLLIILPICVSCYLCSDFRIDFSIPDPLPMFQLIVEDGVKRDVGGGSVRLTGTWETIDSPDSKDPQKPLTGFPGTGLMVPVTADGYCLTAEYLLGTKGAFVLVEPKEHKPLFLVGIDEGRPVVCAVTSSTLGGAPVRGEVRTCADLEIPQTLDADKYQSCRNEKEGIDSPCLISVQVIKAWSADNLALVKVPFPTPSYFPLPEEPTRVWEPVMHFGNPVSHEGALGQMARCIGRRYDSGREQFYTLFSRHRRFLRSGDSGGPAINRNGELVAINFGKGADENGRQLDIAIGIRADLILDAIQKSRSQNRH